MGNLMNISQQPKGRQANQKKPNFQLQIEGISGQGNTQQGRPATGRTSIQKMAFKLSPTYSEVNRQKRAVSPNPGANTNEGKDTGHYMRNDLSSSIFISSKGGILAGRSPKSGKVNNNDHQEKFFGSKMQQIDKELSRLARLINQKENEVNDALTPRQKTSRKSDFVCLQSNETLNSIDNGQVTRYGYEIVLGDLSKKVETLAREAEDNQRTISELRDSEAQLQAALDSANRKNEHLVSENKELKTRTQMMKMQIAELERRLVKTKGRDVSPPLKELLNCPNILPMAQNPRNHRSSRDKLNATLVDENIKLKVRLEEQRQKFDGLLVQSGDASPTREKQKSKMTGSPSKGELIRYLNEVVSSMQLKLTHMEQENARLNQTLRNTSVAHIL
eukprot:TRINITY_DN9223_c0_g1_i3.p1 TRINITY_DN9223_c0_g1~~TRINITY_DN9223_c0_g1_i3.p1  ORF type:complete len:423 (+),score=88.60 TRINITY_DN9223_c0_g1_i3:101-1270(+)